MSVLWNIIGVLGLIFLALLLLCAVVVIVASLVSAFVAVRDFSKTIRSERDAEK